MDRCIRIIGVVLALAFLPILVDPVLAGPVQEAESPAAPTLTVRGNAEDTAGNPVAGVRFDFLPTGSPKKETAATGEDGKYSLDLPVGRYEIQVTRPGQPRTDVGFAFLGPPERKEIVLNARIPEKGEAEHIEYDLLGDWAVVDAQGRRAGTARVTFEALRPPGRPVRLPMYYLTITGDEREAEGQFETDPAGRFVFRVRETYLAPERTVGLLVTAEAPGHAPTTVSVFPELQFSETGHLFAAYPEDLRIPLKERKE